MKLHSEKRFRCEEKKGVSFWIFNYISFGIVYIGYFILTWILFRNQCYEVEGTLGRYTSDMYAYFAKIQGQEVGYNYPYPIMFWVGKALRHLMYGREALALTVALMNSMSLILLKLVYDYFLLYAERQYQTSKKIYVKALVSTFFSISTLFVSMIYPISLIGTEIGQNGSRYKGVFSPNPYHNATYLAARPFAIITVVLFILCYQKYRRSKKWLCWEYMSFSASLLLCTMTKPSFTLVFVAAAGSIMVFHLLKDKDILPFLQFGIYFIPTFIDLLYQYKDVFVGNADSESGMTFGWFVNWGQICDNIPMAVLRLILFPFVVTCVSIWYRKVDKKIGFSWLMFTMGFVTTAFLSEKGYRGSHMNFAWGYMYGAFFLFVICTVTLLKNTMEKTQKLYLLITQWLCYFIHLLMGVCYFVHLFRGGVFS